MVEKKYRHPERSMTAAMGGSAEQEGAFRLLNNSSVSFQGILEGHFLQTAARSELCTEVVIAHDTTDFRFGQGAPREGLAPLAGANSKYGFYAHVSLVMKRSSLRAPLGVVSVQPWVRTEQVRRMREHQGYKEIDRWYEGVVNSEARVGENVSCIHLMDREGDSYELYAKLCSANHRFVIRVCHNRWLENETKLFDEVGLGPVVAERDIYLSKRTKRLTPKARSIYPQRDARRAKLSIRARRIELSRSGWLRRNKTVAPPSLVLNLVEVLEDRPPNRQPAVSWLLLTTEPIDSPQDVLRIVDLYRGRWLIEEYFKALKTGCAYEKSQMTSYDSLLRTLAICIPIAWQLLRLRYLAGAVEDLPATHVLTPRQIEVLRATSQAPLPEVPTAREVLWALAMKSGHTKRSREPGWQVLGRALQDLLVAEQGWAAAMDFRKSDRT